MPGLNGFEVARRVLGVEPGADGWGRRGRRSRAAQIGSGAFSRCDRPYGSRVRRGGLPAKTGRPRAARPGGSGRSGGIGRGPADTPRRRPGAGLATRAAERLVKRIAQGQGRRERLAVKVGERFFLVDAADVIFATLADEVVTVAATGFTGTSNYRTLDDLQAQLDPETFWRVHRAYLVNINKIKEIVPWFSRNYILKMSDAKSTEIPVSRSQTKRLREYLRL
jgi:hypothetical protein